MLLNIIFLTLEVVDFVCTCIRDSIPTFLLP